MPRASQHPGRNKSSKDTIASLKMSSLYNFLAQDFGVNVKGRMMGKLVVNPAEDVSEGQDAASYLPDHLNCNCFCQSHLALASYGFLGPHANWWYV